MKIKKLISSLLLTFMLLFVLALPALAVAPVPTGLTVTPGNQQNVISWTAVAGATSYTVYQDTISIGTPTTNTFTKTGLTNGTTYTYTVTATDGTGTSAQTAGVTGTPTAGLSFTGTTLPFTIADMLGTAVSFLTIYGQWILLALGVIFSPVLYGLAMKLVTRAKKSTGDGGGGGGGKHAGREGRDSRPGRA
jgi:hypothetical protein